MQTEGKPNMGSIQATIPSISLMGIIMAIGSYFPILPGHGGLQFPMDTQIVIQPPPQSLDAFFEPQVSAQGVNTLYVSSFGKHGIHPPMTWSVPQKHDNTIVKRGLLHSKIGL
jgi:hypothetical protein